MDKCIILLFLLATQISANPRFRRMIGGITAEQGEYPFIASLRNTEGFHFCGAGIISEHFLITAAHCIISTSPSTIQAYVGSVFLDHGGSYYDVLRLSTHPDFRYADVMDGNDIGVVQLSASIEMRGNIQILNLPVDVSIDEGDKVVAIGWGDVDLWGDTTNQLKVLERTIISNQECSKDMFQFIGSQQVCFDDTDDNGACYGDSGSPLLYMKNNKTYVVGLTSWGIRCGVDGDPSVYTRVSDFLPWIMKQIKKGNRDAKRSKKFSFSEIEKVETQPVQYFM